MKEWVGDGIPIIISMTEWGECWSPYFFSAIPFPSPTIAPPFFHTFPSLLFFPPLVEDSQKVCRKFVRLPTLPEKNGSQLKKVGEEQIDLVPTISKVGGDASHGSHIVVAPMLRSRCLWGVCLCETAKWRRAVRVRGEELSSASVQRTAAQSARSVQRLMP